ncbi:hypothetical protein E4U61_006288 [Claviceps capensis]|nr:hypothetical protein E4U61_006288 [Claviceps capensis]
MLGEFVASFYGYGQRDHMVTLDASVFPKEGKSGFIICPSTLLGELDAFGRIQGPLALRALEVT